MEPLLKLKGDLSERVRYDYADYPIYIRRALLSIYPNYAAPSHWHNDIELIFICSGAMQYNVNGHIVSLQSGEGIFVNARQMHFGFSNCGRECDFICILLHPILLCTSPSMERDFVAPLLANGRLPYLKFTRQLAWQRSMLEKIEQIYADRKHPAAPLHIQAIFASLWATLYENTSDLKSFEHSSDDNLAVIKNMIGFIQRNYSDKIALGDIAKAGAVGQSKCCKLFNEYLGQTPNTYLTTYRLDKSVELLRDTDLSMAEIALEVGFCGASYFAESFRRWMGQSPTQYKRKWKEKGREIGASL